MAFTLWRDPVRVGSSGIPSPGIMSFCTEHLAQNVWRAYVQVATYRAFTVWRDPEDMSDQDRREGMFQETIMIQELCERGNLQTQRPEAKAQLGKDYLR